MSTESPEGMLPCSRCPHPKVAHYAHSTDPTTVGRCYAHGCGCTDFNDFLDRTNVKPLTEERLAQIEANAKEFLGYGNIHPEGVGLDNNGILWLIGEYRRLKTSSEERGAQLVALDQEKSARLAGVPLANHEGVLQTTRNGLVRFRALEFEIRCFERHDMLVETSLPLAHARPLLRDLSGRQTLSAVQAEVARPCPECSRLYAPLEHEAVNPISCPKCNRPLP